ncbi:MAG: BamA/TamA family outer membrane protein [Bacteroidales bacterium]|nr:BamA/TamA family outer membrane protein [Bacteroidales bacterium]
MKKIIALSLAFLSFLASFSQLSDSTDISFIDYKTSRDYIIADISITGVKYLQPAYLVNISGLTIGQEIPIPGDEISKAIDKFWSFGLFSDVKVLLKKTEGKDAYLEFQLTEQPRLSKARIHGVNKSETTDLEEMIKLKPGSQVTDNVINNAKTAIRKHFHEKGFYNCDVDVVRKDDTIGINKVFLDIYIKKNDKIRISEISFTGNTAYEDKRLRRIMKKTKQVSVNFFKPSKFIEKDYNEDKAKLVEFYNENGYRDMKITDESIASVSDNRIALTLDLEEGKKYFIRNIQWIGNTKYPGEILGRVLGMKKGDIYDKKKIEERLFADEDAITSVYMDEGYLFFSVEPVETNIIENPLAVNTVNCAEKPDNFVRKLAERYKIVKPRPHCPGDSIDLEMRIYEGSPATINRVIIKGNTKTNEHVVRRELRTRPGELFSKSDIIRSVRELATLGHFNPENIVPNPIPNMADGTVDIEYNLEERANDQLEVSGGWGGYGFVGTVGIRFSNFSIRNILNTEAWRPVPTGDGQSLSIRAQSNGKFYQSYNISFMEPWFGGKKPNNFSVSFYHTITKSYYGTQSAETSDDFFKVYGAAISLGKRLKWPDDFFMTFTELGYQRYHLNDWSYFFINNGFSNIVSLKATLTRSSQDQMIYPRKGSVFSMGLQVTPPYSALKKDHFWLLSDIEKNNVRNDVLEQNPSATEYDIATEISARENSEKYKWIEYHKWTFSGAWYTSLVGNLVLAAKAEFGYLGFFNADIGSSPFEKFRVGGSGMYSYNLYGADIISLRGYDDGKITPVTSGNIDNGNVYSKFSVEMRYPFSLNQSATIYGLAFFDGGNCWQSIKEFNPFVMKRSLGVGIRAFLPMFGMLGVDWGYGLDPQPGEDKLRHGSEFHFIMGQQF